MGHRYAMANGGGAITTATWLVPTAGVIGSVFGAIGLWLANRLLGKAAFQTAINHGFQALVDQLQEERESHAKVYEKERMSWEGERAQLRGEIINLTQAVESLKSYLRRNGMDIPDFKTAASGMTIIGGKKDE